LKVKNAESYNIVNEKSHTTILGMAKMVAKEFSKKSKVIIDIPTVSQGYAPNVKLKLSSKKLKNLGWKPNTNLKNSYKKLINYIIENKNF
jgi:nucleoside-diphosphate-sugar epimerase